MKPNARRLADSSLIAATLTVLCVLAFATPAQALRRIPNLNDTSSLFNSCVALSWWMSPADAEEFLFGCCDQARWACIDECSELYPWDLGEDYQSYNEACSSACNVAFDTCAVGGSVAEASLGVPGLYENPVVTEILPSPRVDYCLDGDSGCGAPAAHAFCARYEGPGYAASSFAGDGIPAELDDSTWQLGAWYPRQPYGTGQGFSFIQCEASTQTFPTYDVANDSDDDGITDAQDNCVYEPNPLQRNTDGDLFGDLCDPEPLVSYVCSNGIDDDGDGYADAADPGCLDLFDGDEKASHLVCDDGVDNDADGLIDMADPHCSSPSDDDESPAACANGIDDDGDGLSDLEDPGCAYPSDEAEIDDPWLDNEFEGWSNTYTSRQFADVDGDGRVDIVAFDPSGAHVALSAGDHFAAPTQWTPWYSYSLRTSNSTPIDEKPIFVVDVDGDGRADVLRRRNDEAIVALSTGQAFDAYPVQIWATGLKDAYDISRTVGQETYIVDLTGDGLPDIVTTDQLRVSVARNTGTAFEAETDWYPATAPRFMSYGASLQFADVDGDGLRDHVHFGDTGTWVALNTGTSFADPVEWTLEFGMDHDWYQRHTPRMLADVNGDGREDVVGFKHDAVYVALSTGSGFTPRTVWQPDVHSTASEWNQAVHHKFLVDLNHDGMSDFLGFGPHGLVASFSDGTTFGGLIPLGKAFTYETGWSDEDDVRALGDADGDGRIDVLGIHSQGTKVGQLRVLESFIPVPEPGVASGLVAGLGLLGWLARRRTATPTPDA